MSSMRNAVQRRNHKERAQPEERAKWGLLEKRKDYKLRAADYREKKKRLRILSEKAKDRNPDEFSFAMMSSRVDSKGRKITDRGNKALSTDVVKLLKTQDAGYIRTMLQEVRKEREKLEQKILVDKEEVRVLGDIKGSRKGRHTVYVGNVEEQHEFDPDEWKQPHNPDAAEEQDVEEDEERPKKLSRKQQEAALLARKEAAAERKKRQRVRERLALHLESVKARERDLMAAEEELELQRAKMNNTVGGINKQGVKFKIRERKR